MITSEEIAVKVYHILCDASIQGATISWQRKGYESTKEIVVVPHYATGEGSMRTAVVKVNIHVPDIYDSANNGYEIDFVNLIALKKAVISSLNRYTWAGTGVNISISALEQPIKEPEYNEHFSSVTLTAYIRERREQLSNI